MLNVALWAFKPWLDLADSTNLSPNIGIGHSVLLPSTEKARPYDLDEEKPEAYPCTIAPVLSICLIHVIPDTNRPCFLLVRPTGTTWTAVRSHCSMFSARETPPTGTWFCPPTGSPHSGQRASCIGMPHSPTANYIC